METIKKAFNVIVGYSDHTLGDHISCAAVAMGAKIIEKHFTLNRDFKGPDHSFAIEYNELKDMVNKIRDIEIGMGDGIKNGPRHEEMEFYRNARRSVIAKRNIKKGQVIKDEDLIVKRPNYGIHPKFLSVIIGRKAKVEIIEDEPVTWEKI